MKGKLWIIGDSFTMIDTGRYGNNSWPEICSKTFKGGNYYVSSMASRDIETIFDIFLENLHKINSDDFVILMLPTLTRFRLPLANPYVNSTYYSDSRNDYPLNYMIGATNYSAHATNLSKEDTEEHKKSYMLEWPLSEIDPMTFQPNEDVRYPNLANIMQMINSSKAFANNWNSKLKSIQSYVPFKLLYYSWTDEYHSDCVVGKSEIISNLGFWESLDDAWKETSGKQGVKDDFHWSPKMHESFANYIIQTNSEYFNK